MSRVDAHPGTRGSLRPLWLSAAVAVVPVAAAFLLPPGLRSYEAFSWLLLLVPSFVWAYHRGWRGVALALAAGVVLMALTYATVQPADRTFPELMLPVVAVYALVTLGVGLLRDRLARTEREEVSERLALLDQLTGLPNRRHAELQLEMEFAAAERGRALSVVMFDIDNMQQYNARHGRAAGDAVLIGFAALLRQQKRRMDLAARCGPEAFVAILAGCMEEGAVIFAARVQEHLRAGRSATPLPTVSAGVAVYSPDMLTPEDLLSAAADALRLAKADGRDRVRIHGRGMDEMREPDSGAVQRAASESLALDGGPRVELRPFDSISRGRDAVGQGRSALVMASNEVVRASLLDVLAGEGFQVAEAATVPDSALPLQHDFDLVFVDLAAHAGAAAELVREIRFRSPTTRVVGITAAQGDSVPTELLRIRVDGHYVHAAGDAAIRQQMRELLAERDALTNVQLRQRQIAAGADPDRRQPGIGERYRNLVQNVGDVLLTVDAEGRLTFVNPAWTALSGVPVEQSLGRPLFDFFVPDDQPLLRADFDRAFSDGGQLRRDARMLTAAGTERWLEVRLQRAAAAAPAAGNPGSVAAGPGGDAVITGVLSDVTERRRGEEALRQSEASFRSLIENAADLMVLLNADATVRYVSPAVRRILGTEPDECVGTDPFERIHPEDVQRARQGLGALLEEPGAEASLPMRVRHADGSWCSIEARGRNLLLTAGVEGIVVDGRVIPESRA
jgi:diguanylate cyclase (GGDEF)-like protein/PAS domain S-box-containing protein